MPQTVQTYVEEELEAAKARGDIVDPEIAKFTSKVVTGEITVDIIPCATGHTSGNDTHIFAITDSRSQPPTTRRKCRMMRSPFA